MNNDTLERDTTRGTTMIDSWKEIEDKAEADEESAAREAGASFSSILSELTLPQLEKINAETDDMGLVGVVAVFSTISQYLKEPANKKLTDGEIERAIEIGKEFKELQPYIKHLLKTKQFKKLKFNYLDILLALKSEFNGLKPNKAEAELFKELIARARELRDTSKKENVNTIALKKNIDGIRTGHDKLNNSIFNNFITLKKNTDGLIPFDFASEKAKVSAPVYYSLNWDKGFLKQLELKDELTSTDRTYHDILATLWHNGVRATTISQLFEMDNNKKGITPNEKQARAILDSLRKMQAATVYINNIGACKTFEKSGTYKEYEITTHLLPITIASGSINGRIVENVIYINNDFPLMTLAEKCNNQISTRPPCTYDIGVKTERTRELGYIIWERISSIQNANYNKRKPQYNKITYDHVFNKLSITDRKEKQRIKTKIIRILKPYIDNNIISYEVETDGIVIKRPKR